MDLRPLSLEGNFTGISCSETSYRIEMGVMQRRACRLPTRRKLPKRSRQASCTPAVERELLPLSILTVVDIVSTISWMISA